MGVGSEGNGKVAEDLGFDLLERGRIDVAVVRMVYEDESSVDNATEGIIETCWVYTTIYRSFGAIGIDGKEAIDHQTRCEIHKY